MGAAAIILMFGCWLVGAAGMAHAHRRGYRFLKGRPVPARGPRLAVERVRRPLPDVKGRRGNFRGLVWHGTPDGLTCQSPESIAVASCRPDGGETLYEARFPASSLVMVAGMLGFLVVGAVVMATSITRFEWTLLIPPGLMLFIGGMGWFQFRRARKAAREMVWYVDGLLAELADPPPQ